MSGLVLDVNVVLGAHRDDHAHHALLRRWLDDVAGGSQAFSVPAVVWTSFLRLVTSRRAFKIPTPLVDAFAFIDAIRAQPRHLALEPGPRHLQLLRRLCEDASATGDLVPDAVIAAIALEHSCAVVSLDRDFARFAAIEHVVPSPRSSG